MPLTPTFGPMSLNEAQDLLQGLYRVDLRQLREGRARPVSPLLHMGAVRYIRRDPRERWRTAREIERYGGGDCEDLAAAVAAERTLMGHPSRPIIMRVGPGQAHAVVMDLRTRRITDPSVTGGMPATTIHTGAWG